MLTYIGRYEIANTHRITSDPGRVDDLATMQRHSWNVACNDCLRSLLCLTREHWEGRYKGQNNTMTVR